MTIVTTVHRYKRPPEKRKAVELDVPAIVTKRSVGPQMSPPTDDDPEPAAASPANDDIPTAPAPAAKPTIIATTGRKRTKLLRGAEPDDPEADAAMRAWLERAKWGPGPAK